MKTLRPEIIAAAEWLQEAIDATRFGEVALTFRMHEGREALQERTQTSRIKDNSTGNTGGRHADTR
ncbi:MAG: hypothetical protein AB7T74_03020 [Clostridia bacterium]